MQPFELRTPDGVIVSGLHHIPPCGEDRPEGLPLIVGVHGAGYTSRYYDVNENLSAQVFSTMTGTPFVAIDRPCYNRTTSVLPVALESSFHEAWGGSLHDSILPALWTTFGVSNGCTGIVILCHSLGATGGTVAASLNGSETSPSYPLLGLIISGFASDTKYVISETREKTKECAIIKGDWATLPLDLKESLMTPKGTVDPSLYQYSAELDHPMPCLETIQMTSSWLPSWRKRWATGIAVPVLILLGGRDCFFDPSQEHLDDYAAAFTSSARVDKSLVPGAPHSIEQSYWSRGWYLRIFGFATECAASQYVEQLSE